MRDGRAVAALVPLDAVRPADERSILESLAAQGHITLPEISGPSTPVGPPVRGRGKSAAEMVIEDRTRWE